MSAAAAKYTTRILALIPQHSIGSASIAKVLRAFEDEITARIKGNIIRQCEAGDDEMTGSYGVPPSAPPAQPLKVVRQGMSGTCPKCGEPFSVDIVASAADESRVRFALHTEPGQSFSAKNLGGILEQLHRLFASAGKDVGRETLTFVEKIESVENGYVFHLLLARAPSKKAAKR